LFPADFDEALRMGLARSKACMRRGDLHTGEILLGGLRATEGNGKLRLAAGHFLLEDFGLKLPQGRFLLGQFDADLTRDPFPSRKCTPGTDIYRGV